MNASRALRWIGYVSVASLADTVIRDIATHFHAGWLEGCAFATVLMIGKRMGKVGLL